MILSDRKNNVVLSVFAEKTTAKCFIWPGMNRHSLLPEKAFLPRFDPPELVVQVEFASLNSLVNPYGLPICVESLWMDSAQFPSSFAPLPRLPWILS